MAASVASVTVPAAVSARGSSKAALASASVAGVPADSRVILATRRSTHRCARSFKVGGLRHLRTLVLFAAGSRRSRRSSAAECTRMMRLASNDRRGHNENLNQAVPALIQDDFVSSSVRRRQESQRVAAHEEHPTRAVFNDAEASTRVSATPLESRRVIRSRARQGVTTPR